MSASSCIAVGGPDDAPGPVLVDRWNGKRWSIVPVPQPQHTEQGLLRAVSCLPNRDCVAVGAVLRRGGVWSAVVERLAAGRWTVALAPERRKWTQSLLRGVSCTTATACTAVGSYEDQAGAWLPLAERWDGSRWTVQSAGQLPYGELDGVSCQSTSSCTAVGTNFASQLIEHWNGVRWSIVRSAGSGTEETVLHALSCASDAACTAVGESVIVDIGTFPLAERWTGIGWSTQRVVRQLGGFNGVSCGSANACVAVGEGELIERWNGHRWSVRRANIGTPEKSLYAVSCIGASACTAVGSTVDRTGREVPLVETLG